MERFLLLRDNHEQGPFTLEELKLLGLKSSDLVWVEGKSLAWDYPFNIKELKEYIRLFSSEDFLAEKALKPQDIFPNTAESFPIFSNEESGFEPVFAEPVDEHPNAAKMVAGKSFFTTYGLWLIAMVVLLAGTTWVMKKAVDVFNGNGVSGSKLTAVAAPLKTLPEGVAPQKGEDATIQNAISREIVPVDTAQEKEPVLKKPKLKELKKYLQIESNDYKVGVFGGINNLQLTIINNSAYILDKVVLQVDYLKPKGEPLQTEKYTYFSIPAHGKKTLDIPPSKRGVKVKYRIVDAKSREYKVALVQA